MTARAGWAQVGQEASVDGSPNLQIMGEVDEKEEEGRREEMVTLTPKSGMITTMHRTFMTELHKYRQRYIHHSSVCTHTCILCIMPYGTLLVTAAVTHTSSIGLVVLDKFTDGGETVLL